MIILPDHTLIIIVIQVMTAMLVVHLLPFSIFNPLEHSSSSSYRPLAKEIDHLVNFSLVENLYPGHHDQDLIIRSIILRSLQDRLFGDSEV